MTTMDEPNAASVALIENGRVLLIQRAFEPLASLWTLPGGRREPGETIEATAIRELREELALTVDGLEPVMQLGVVGKFRLQVFYARRFAGVIAPSPEVANHRWSTPAELAALPTTPQLAEVVARAFAIAGLGDSNFLG